MSTNTVAEHVWSSIEDLETVKPPDARGL